MKPSKEGGVRTASDAKVHSTHTPFSTKENNYMKMLIHSPPPIVLSFKGHIISSQTINISHLCFLLAAS